ncbi:MAG: family transcriptional regulator [Streptosporangiaceae bacterium]|jgi:predicted NBD/HSP70 family sugar kinase|nr:family transcriptional regulator [Streptosporangiaceae bacterium]
MIPFFCSHHEHNWYMAGGQYPGDRAQALRLRGVLDVLRHVHLRSATTRAGLARELGLSRGSATEIMARLRALSLVEEGDAAPGGGRGRPTRAVGPHPAGPLALTVDISYERWRLAVAEVGGGLRMMAEERHPPGRHPAEVLARVSHAITEAREELGPRLAALGVSVAGTVSEGRVVQAGSMGWRDVEVARALSLGPVPVVVGNDATLAGVTEARRGAARGAGTALYLTVEVGIGGVLLDQGHPVSGGTGTGGEFGHVPFGDPERRCPCGAYGCWDQEVDGRALARLLGAPPPADPRLAAGEVLDRARRGDPEARAAAETVARSLGRGIAGLVNALDPRIVTLAGLAATMLEVAGPAVDRAYHGGLMSFRRDDPPPLVRSEFPQDGSLRGAADLAFDAILSEAGLNAWREILPATS